ncbi:hypothetical protein GMD78_06245 [Ornithinibacillus sp. L9]|uniref:DUF2071 domain-containing protein n=1 Tax=Ornithinibacillus caprae TaxID=2678566 RepID=A0A6N8FL28_9BACI|nr:DUF2071 domain-containing protein [Ornithinibacillus caprae]MUK87998.1 hypothetical protein [Ornithinibacillus caprae]
MMEEIIRSTAHREYSLPKVPWLVMQKWEKLLFLHWPLSTEKVKRHLPTDLELDTYNGEAWMSMVAFKVNDMRFRRIPLPPYFKSSLQLNVRTYVKRNGVRGVYFFQIDTNHLPTVIGARLATLPYSYAKMSMVEKEGEVTFSSSRKEEESGWNIQYSVAEEKETLEKGSISHWLLERYFLWTFTNGKLYAGAIHHKQWKVQDANVHIDNHSMSDFLDTNVVNKPAIVHYADSKKTLIYPMKRV